VCMKRRREPHPLSCHPVPALPVLPWRAWLRANYGAGIAHRREPWCDLYGTHLHLRLGHASLHLTLHVFVAVAHPHRARRAPLEAGGVVVNARGS